MTHFKQRLAFPASAMALAVLAACGGGSGTEDAVVVPPVVPPVNLTGTVAINGFIKNAVVCLDINANGACDATEPTSAKTGADGAYSITFERAAVAEAEQAAASLIALMVPGTLEAPTTTVDQNDATTTVTEKAYVLKQLPGKAGQINPLTTLVSAGVAAGMTEAVARTNAAAQLAIAEAKIDNYQDDALFTGDVMDNARMMAMAVATGLGDGITLVVGDPSVAGAAAPSDLRAFSYTNASNYRFTDFLLQGRAAGAATANLTDNRVGKAGGVEMTSGTLYNQAYLTPQGWLRCDASTSLTATLGRPNRSQFCGAANSVSFRTNTSVAERPMADVVTELAANTVNAITSSPDLLAALGSVKFPADSAVRVGKSLNLNTPIYINSISTDGLRQTAATTLDQLPAAFPSTAVNLATASGTLGLGLSTGSFKVMRVAFTGTTSATAGTVQYYDCDLNQAQTASSNCVATQAGTYSIDAVQGVRVMTFANAPATPASPTTRLFVEVKASTQANAVIGDGDWVFSARQNKPAVSGNLTSNTRLNGTGWAAMKAQLGL